MQQNFIEEKLKRASKQPNHRKQRVSGNMNKKEIQDDAKKIFEFWQKERKKAEIRVHKLKDKYSLINLKSDEVYYTITDYPMSDQACKFVEEFYKLCRIPYDKVREFIVKLGYEEWDDDIFYSSWRKGEGIITIPHDPLKLEEIEIEKQENNENCS